MSEEYDEGYRRGYENGYEDAEENYCETIVELKARIAELEAENKELKTALRKWRVILNQDGSENCAAREAYRGDKE